MDVGLWHRLVVSALVVVGCGVDSRVPSGPESATVLFAYLASAATDPAIAAAYPACVNGVGQTHIHPSWRGFARFDMAPVAAQRWEITFIDVPLEQDLRIRVSDGNACSQTNPTGASTTDVFANGVLLTRVVDTPGSGIEPGLGLRVARDGTVMP